MAILEQVCAYYFTVSIFAFFYHSYLFSSLFMSFPFTIHKRGVGYIHGGVRYLLIHIFPNYPGVGGFGVFCEYPLPMEFFIFPFVCGK